MNVSETKLELIELLLNTKNDLVLNKVRTILENNEEEIKGYSVICEPFTEYEYNKKLEKAALDFKNGNFISHNNLKKKYNI